MVRKYEIILFYDPELDDNTLSLELQEFEKLVAKADGSIINKSTPKLVEMGYRIKKKKNGYYVLVDFDAAPDGLKSLARALKLRDAILRHTIIVKKKEKALL